MSFVNAPIRKKDKKGRGKLDFSAGRGLFWHP